MRTILRVKYIAHCLSANNMMCMSRDLFINIMVVWLYSCLHTCFEKKAWSLGGTREHESHKIFMQILCETVFTIFYAHYSCFTICQANITLISALPPFKWNEFKLQPESLNKNWICWNALNYSGELKVICNFIESEVGKDLLGNWIQPSTLRINFN